MCNFAFVVFFEIQVFIVKNWLYIYDSKYCPLVYFWLLHKNVSAAQPGLIFLIETNDSQGDQCLENKRIG